MVPPVQRCSRKAYVSACPCWLLLSAGGRSPALRRPRLRGAGARAPASASARAPNRPRCRTSASKSRPAPSAPAASPASPVATPSSNRGCPRSELGGFQIDRLALPERSPEASAPNVSFDDAKRLRRTRRAPLQRARVGARVQGSRQRSLPERRGWDTRCSKEPLACATGFDVLGMGTGAGEWTGSQRGSLEKRVSLVRGAGASAPAAGIAARRAARRSPTSARSISAFAVAGARPTPSR